MSIERKLDSVHKLMARTAGQMAMALVRRKISKGQLEGWGETVKQCTAILEELRGKTGASNQGNN